MRHFIASAFALFILAACSRPAAPPPPESDEDKTVRWLNDVVGPIDHCAKTHRCSEDTLGELADKAQKFDDRFAGCGMARRALDLIPAEHWTDTQKRIYRDCGPATFLKQ